MNRKEAFQFLETADRINNPGGPIAAMPTPRERVMAAVDLKSADAAVPVVPQITYANARLTGISFEDGMRDPEKMAKALVAGYRAFGYDGIYVGWESSFNLAAEAMGCTLRPGGGGIPSVSGGIVNGPDDLGKVLAADPERDGRLPLHLKALELVRSEVGGDVPLFRYVPGPLTLAGLLRGQDRFLGDLIRNPDLIRELLKLATAASRRFAAAVAERGADVVVVADPMASSSVISPKMFEQFALPYIREVLAEARGAGCVPSLHVCGRTGPILRKMAETGARIVELDYAVDLKAAKEEIGRAVCIEGNVDPVSILLHGRPEDVEKEARDCVSKAGQGGGLILSSGCEVPLDTPAENIRALVSASGRDRQSA